MALDLHRIRSISGADRSDLIKMFNLDSVTKYDKTL